MYLGIEIGGTKLQLAVGAGEGPPLVEQCRAAVDPRGDAQGILRQIAELAAPLVERHAVRALGIGFGGPVDADRGRTLVSHQVEGWKDFPLVAWCRERFGLPARLGNDSDLAGLAEARFGAGRGHRVVLYSNVGSGIGGALVVDGELYRGGSGIAAEIGHLRPGLHCEEPEHTVESLGSGWAIAEAARSRLGEPISHPLQPLTEGLWTHHREVLRQRLIAREEADEADAADLLERCGGRAEQLTTAVVAQAAVEGNRLAREVFEHAAQVYGWALAQAVTLVAPNRVVLGGGVALAGEDLWIAPVRRWIDRYVFPPLRGRFTVAAAALGEEVVLHGALALARAETAPPANR